MNIEKQNLYATIVIVLVLTYLYYQGKLDVILSPIENMYSWVHYSLWSLMACKDNLLNKKENYSACAPYDCTKYRVRKDQLIVRNPFKWPWSGSDFPQYAVQYDEINKSAAQTYEKRPCWRSHNVVNCENCRCANPIMHSQR